MLRPKKYSCQNPPLFRTLSVFLVGITPHEELYQKQLLCGGISGEQLEHCGVWENIQIEYRKRGGVQGVNEEGGGVSGRVKNIYNRVTNSCTKQSG